MIERKLTEEKKLGGSDIEFREEYETDDSRPSFNKKDHFERSLSHQPNHLKVVKKVKLFKEVSEAFFKSFYN
ncbi:MAG: hypothetical protein UT58_C0033G0006 [Microgenomates group bacterium GW2011_GWC1_39_7b]|uniref:Uncharacterized protein n=3 Tax=Candidatus Woeseibacteriota TaxID=1752722 RepID=A0A0G0LIQ1_9BACT|nr:MAG: hypothetical protein UT17_C0004G0111 [Candidatus Woesebacteria bacterium GW2011_GWB1_39_10]KKR25812.1 MAG: hypothetical protein UT58_C0033G0006 [Microgenomates group bacterium GW2011_GWC1_39_7b]KKR74373.1 MAG: hypothetical protein UU16_C0001G0024 [Candidatus Woesebacteria bacterium GW2011_GWA2_40_7]KKS90755.1 MAG: hypothetical protein UV66_C0001G0112 [Candidatus Woesebacteria bacterium GW2011_GWA1_43_12]